MQKMYVRTTLLPPFSPRLAKVYKEITGGL